MEESSGGIGRRLRSAARGARDRLTGTADAVTGVQSRRQWEAFTDAVTRTVVGVHRDQEELRKAQGQTIPVGIRCSRHNHHPFLWLEPAVCWNGARTRSRPKQRKRPALGNIAIPFALPV